MSLEVADPIAHLPAPARAALAQRLGQVLDTLGGSSTGDPHACLVELERLLADHDPGHWWLAFSAISGHFATEDDVHRLTRAARLHGARAALQPAIDRLARDVTASSAPVRTVEIVRDLVTITVGHTSNVTFTSGIQRVVRECVHRWCTHPRVRLVSWTPGSAAFRPVREEEWDNVTLGLPFPDDAASADTITIPWGGTHLVPELALDPPRAARIAALARYTPTTVGMIGYDVIPLTTPSSVVQGMVSTFTRYLATTAHVDRVTAISQAAGDEYLGWRAMLAGRGLEGPDVLPISLPVAARSTTAEQIEEARRLLTFRDSPLVLVVGSHEPRKNHLAVLHAAELLWREGHRFSMAFVGAGSWRAEAFYDRVHELQAEGRELLTISGLSDELLWASYRLAHCVVFPSLNEGYGLPVAEALACGTPVVTSGFGSMADIVAPDGAPLGGLLIDPHDDHDLAGALRALLTDEALHARLSAEATTHRLGSWDDYAADVWDYLVHGRIPAPRP